MKNISLFLVAFFLTGCVATGPIFSQIEKPKEGMAKLYLLRQKAFAGGGYCPSLKYNGGKIGCLKNNGFIAVDLLPGESVIKGGDVELILTAEPGKLYFFEYVPSGSIANAGVGYVGIYTSGMVQRTTEYAMSILPRLKDSSL